MARAASEDFLTQNNFHLLDLPEITVPTVFPFQQGRKLLRGDLAGSLSFANATVPEMTIESFDVRAGNDPFDKSIGFRASTGTMSLQKGVFPQDNDFAVWWYGYLFGPVSFRRNLVLVHTRHDKSVAKSFLLVSCRPERVKPDGDFDATSGEISLAELDVNVEQVISLPLVAAGLGL